jgi:putative transposase
MSRRARIAPGGIIYHVLNRAIAKTRLFRTRKDYEAFQRCLIQTLEVAPIRLLSYCVMPNHWHLLLWPEKDRQLARFMMRLTNTHVRRWMTAHDQVGSGHLYQGRYKSFPMQSDEHLSTVARYVERNARRANLVDQAQQWPWSSIGQTQLPALSQVPLCPWPIPRRDDWIQWVNANQTVAEQEAVRECIRKAMPFGSDAWIAKTLFSQGWKPFRKPGRPRLPKK